MARILPVARASAASAERRKPAVVPEAVSGESRMFPGEPPGALR
jgi:hypothetical protein